MMDIDRFVSDYQPRWEGGMSRDPNDNGNWFLYGAAAQKKGQGVLVGSNIGVTGAVLAAYRGKKTMTMDEMAKLTPAEAKAIAIKLFFKDPGLINLEWNPVTASVMDFGWGAGPVRAIRMLQDVLDTNIDGVISPGGDTVKRYADKCQRKGLEFMAGVWWTMREEYYEDLVAKRPSDGIYLKGWDNRSDYFTPGHSEGWWKRFMAA